MKIALAAGKLAPHSRRSTTLAVLTLTALLAACASSPMAPPFSQTALPAAVQVPAGHTVALETVGKGQITYECRAKKDMPAAFEWAFVGPDAVLLGRGGQTVGRYYGPPATWQAADGSKITGAQLAISPAGAGNIPMQLVKANAAIGAGAMAGMAYIQRVATVGGVAPAAMCDSGAVGKKEIVNYQADYIFWKAT